MAWYTENKNKDVVDSKHWSTKSKKSESREKVWKYRHNLTLEQSALCVALQHQYFEKNMDNGVPVAIGSHKYAYKTFCSLPMEMQNEVVNYLQWVKLPISRRVRNFFVNYPGLSSVSLGGIATGISYKIIKKYSDSKK
ncbi:hypothetical protein KAH94_03335 [bacterium]|nr:hypothetical protein [bacterium]